MAAPIWNDIPTFGELLRHLRRRARLTQRELAQAVGYSEGQINKLEKNLRKPDYAVVAALFLRSLNIEAEPALAARLLELAAASKQPRSTAHTSAQHSLPTRTATHNLPRPPSRFIGREDEVAGITSLLAEPDVQLLTLVGAPGIGKTRLGLAAAMRVAHQFEDGACFVPLAGVQTMPLALAEIARALGLRESSSRPIETAVCDHLRERHMLLLLDNLEHVPGLALVVADWLTHCPRIKLLATSRAPLRIRAERRFRVAPLADADAMALFVERASAVNADFVLDEVQSQSQSQSQYVLSICRQLDGLPLAIELAAAQMDRMSAQELAAQLQQRYRLDVLAEGPADLPPHQRTLRSAIAWSYDQLDRFAKRIQTTRRVCRQL